LSPFCLHHLYRLSMSRGHLIPFVGHPQLIVDPTEDISNVLDTRPHPHDQVIALGFFEIL
jgi:hypothetical protein